VVDVEQEQETAFGGRLRGLRVARKLVARLRIAHRASASGAAKIVRGWRRCIIVLGRVGAVALSQNPVSIIGVIPGRL
jgi:hypothetical protein